MAAAAAAAVKVDTNFALIAAAAAARGIKIDGYSQNWIKVLSKEGASRIVYGYKWSVNPAGSALTCSDKAAASDVMKAHKIPHIRHRLFLSPALGDWAPKEGSWPAIHDYAKKHGGDLVCKPKDGTGGEGISHVKTGRELETVVSEIFKKSNDVVLCAFKKIVTEYRVIVLDGHVELIFRKSPAGVTGDGEKSVAELVVAYLAGLDSKRAAAVAKNIDPSILASKDVPAKDTVIPLHWKHNLGQGAACELIDGESYRAVTGASAPAAEAPVDRLVTLALRTVKALDMGFCSVDVVQLAKDDKVFRVMEVNSGVMMDNLVKQHGDIGKGIAERIVGKAIDLLFR